MAEARLLALGYRLSWRWSHATSANTDFAEAHPTAPDAGWISGTAVGSSGELIVFVSDPSRPFGGGPVALLSGCPSATP